MSIQVSGNIPINVVEIGNEITQAKIDEINSGSLATEQYVGLQILDVQTWVTNQGYSTTSIPEPPSDNLVYGRKYYEGIGSWEVIESGGGGGSYLSLSGGSMDSNSVITIANSTSDIRYGSDYIGLNLTGSSGSTGATFDYAGISIFDGSNNVNISTTQYVVQNSYASTTVSPASINLSDTYSLLTITSTGITFPDNTTQTTAVNAYTVDKIKADTIISTYGYGYGNTATFNWPNMPAFVANLGSSWGLTNGGSSMSFSYGYSSGSQFTCYFTGYLSSGPYYIYVNSTNSSYSV